jgi:hypothetical protein
MYVYIETGKLTRDERYKVECAFRTQIEDRRISANIFLARSCERFRSCRFSGSSNVSSDIVCTTVLA